MFVCWFCSKNEYILFSAGLTDNSQFSASQSTTEHDGPAEQAIDGNTNGRYESKWVTWVSTHNSE